MSKAKTSDLFKFIILSIILIKYIGFKAYTNLLYQIFKIFNMILTQLYNTSILSIIFKYFIVYPIVGILLSVIGSPRGKKGHVIGKILYFIVGYFVGMGLDWLSQLIF